MRHHETVCDIITRRLDTMRLQSTHLTRLLEVHVYRIRIPQRWFSTALADERFSAIYKQQTSVFKVKREFREVRMGVCVGGGSLSHPPQFWYT